MTPAKIEAINYGIARDYLEPAVEYLKDKKFMKPRKLARYLDVTPHRAARILSVLEWEKLWKTSQYRNPIFVRKGEGWDDE